MNYFRNFYEKERKLYSFKIDYYLRFIRNKLFETLQMCVLLLLVNLMQPCWEKG